MKLILNCKKDNLHVVKTGFKVTGVTVNRYKGKNILAGGKVDQNSCEMKDGDGDTDRKLEKKNVAGTSFAGKDVPDSWVRKKTSLETFAVSSVEIPGIRDPKEQIIQAGAGREDKEDGECRDDRTDRKTDKITVRSAGISAAVVKRQKNNLERKHKAVYQEHPADPIGQTKNRLELLEADGTKVKKNKVTFEAMAKLCNVDLPESSRTQYNTTKKEDVIRGEVNEEDFTEPWVCSEEEREKIRQKKLHNQKYIKAVVTELGTNKKGKHTDGIKKKLLREYVIRKMVNNQGEKDPNDHLTLVGQMIRHDIEKTVAKLIKLLLGLLVKLFLALLPVILIASVIAMIFIGLYMKFESPDTYYDGYYDNIQEIKDNPKYLKNVIQEMERTFAGNVEYFLSLNGLNEVVYAYGTYSDAEDIAAVYLAQITTDPNYSAYMDQETEGYPAYLFIDTEQESELLSKIFKQFNYTQKETVKKTVTNDKGVEESKDAEKMTVYCLTLETWKSEHGNEISEEAMKVLDELAKKKNDTQQESDIDFGSENAVPIEDLIIPEGVDENLVYLAGFIKAEAGNQSDVGKTAVAYVILNRAGGASGNIKGVLTAPYQFSCYIPYHTVEKYLYAYANMSQEQREKDSCYKAAAGAYYGTAENPIGEMKYYCNPKYCSVGETKQWEKIRARNFGEQIKVIGDHVFCQNCW